MSPCFSPTAGNHSWQPPPAPLRLTAISDAMTAEGDALDAGDQKTAAKYAEAGRFGPLLVDILLDSSADNEKKMNFQTPRISQQVPWSSTSHGLLGMFRLFRPCAPWKNGSIWQFHRQNWENVRIFTLTRRGLPNKKGGRDPLDHFERNTCTPECTGNRHCFRYFWSFACDIFWLLLFLTIRLTNST